MTDKCNNHNGTLHLVVAVLIGLCGAVSTAVCALLAVMRVDVPPSLAALAPTALLTLVVWFRQSSKMAIDKLDEIHSLVNSQKDALEEKIRVLEEAAKLIKNRHKTKPEEKD